MILFSVSPLLILNPKNLPLVLMEKRNFIQRIVSNQVVQAFLIYISGGWVALEITDYIIQNYGLNSRVRDVLSVILLIGLPVVIFLAWYLGKDQETDKAKRSVKSGDIRSQRIFNRVWRRRWLVLPGIVIILLLIMTGIRRVHFNAKVKWALEEVLPQMQDLVHDWDHVAAFNLRQQVIPYIPDNPEFQRLDTLITRKLTVLTDPPGASVYYKEYRAVEGEWIFLGTSPVIEAEMPNFTILRWKMAMDGYEDTYAAATTDTDTLFRTLHKKGEIPDGMVFVEGINDQLTGDYLSPEKWGFYIDKYEVTNQQYKAFVDAGGYREPRFWTYPFVVEQDTLAFEKAMEFFTDQTGRPGPAGWEAGDFPDGEEQYPVNGISWYEAAAYATFAGKSLPTLDHWRSAAGLTIFRYNELMGSNVLPLSNMTGEGPEAAGHNQGMSCFGSYDMGGNVREWCWNSAPAGRIVMGGAWNDVSYMSSSTSQLPAFNRSLKNGFRCVIMKDRERVSEEVFKPFQIADIRDFLSEVPVTDAEFQIMKKQFLYDKMELNSVVEERDESPEDWILEKISFDAAYEGERMLAYLFLPRNAVPPYQTLVYFPGSNALNTSSIFGYRTTSRNLYYILKNGRAVIYPIYAGTHDRRGQSCNSETPVLSHQFTECTIKWVKDLSRSVDYLETRDDIDMERIGYLGDSWGARLGAMIPAVEERLKLSILLRGGFRETMSFPEVDEFNYISRVKVPTLMLNGKYDFTFPYETSVKPYFDLLGTPVEDKKLVLFDTDHFIPTSKMVGEVLGWLDKYFGPVQREPGQPAAD